MIKSKEYRKDFEEENPQFKGKSKKIGLFIFEPANYTIAYQKWIEHTGR